MFCCPPKSFIKSNEIEIGVIEREINLMFNIQHFVADVFYIMPTFFIFTQPICGHQEACRTEVTKKNNDVARRRKGGWNYSNDKKIKITIRNVKMRTFNT